MKSLLVLNRVKVEGANAIAGMVYGFPAITHFLGYVHSLSRELSEKIGVKLGGCAIISHAYEIQAHRMGGWGDRVFSLSKHPLLKDGSTPSFNEEGKIHMEISLVIECDFTVDDFNFSDDNTETSVKRFQDIAYQMASMRRLAGGVITEIASVEFLTIPQDVEEIQPYFKKRLRKLMPGFVLQSRPEILKMHLAKHPHIDPLDALLDFYVLKSKVTPSLEGRKVSWDYIPKASGGWLVPLQIGYKAISPLYKEGSVANARDRSVPFRFVEPVYGLGEWMGLHRVRDPETIFWRYSYDHDQYLCLNEVKY